MDKDADVTLEAVVKIVVSIAVLVLIVGIIAVFYFALVSDSEAQKIKEQMDNLEEIAKKANVEITLLTVDFFPPVGWYLKTFPNFNYPDGACKSSQALSCLCICNDIACSDSKNLDCRWFDFKLEVDGVYTQAVSAGTGGASTIEHENMIRLRNSVYNLNIIKEGEVVKIRE